MFRWIQGRSYSETPDRLPGDPTEIEQDLELAAQVAQFRCDDVPDQRVVHTKIIVDRNL